MKNFSINVLKMIVLWPLLVVGIMAAIPLGFLALAASVHITAAVAWVVLNALGLDAAYEVVWFLCLGVGPTILVQLLGVFATSPQVKNLRGRLLDTKQKGA